MVVGRGRGVKACLNPTQLEQQMTDAILLAGLCLDDMHISFTIV